MFSDHKKNKVQQVSDLSKSQNKISEGTKIIGDIISEGGFRVEGTIEGSFKTTGKVVVGKSGYIKGTLQSSDADFEGKFSGTLLVSGVLSLKPTAEIEGDVTAGKLAIEPGANLNATCNMKGNLKTIGKTSGHKPERTQEKEKSA